MIVSFFYSGVGMQKEKAEEGVTESRNGEIGIPGGASVVLPKQHAGFLIRGVKRNGQKFRPSDWCHRLEAAATVSCGYCSSHGGRAINPYVRVVVDDGIYCLYLKNEMQVVDPALYDFIVRFSYDNQLQMVSIKQGDVYDVAATT